MYSSIFLRLCYLFVIFKIVYGLNITFEPPAVSIEEEDQVLVNFTLSQTVDNTEILFKSRNSDIAIIISGDTFNTDDVTQVANFTIEGVFLGRTQIDACWKESKSKHEVCQSLPVTVLKRERAISKAFVISVAVLVSLNYINIGCALDLKVVKKVLLKPTGAIVGFFCQYLLMPLIAYGAGQWFLSNPILQLGLFTFGCSPGGEASNMWTVLLRGNLNLSITMTFITTISALGMIPLWLFTLGKSLFVTAKIPFERIFTILISMTFPLGIGLLLQRYVPRAAAFCKRILAPVSIVMILFIIIFGIYANLYMFKLFSWEIVLAAIMNVWLGFLISGLVCKACGFDTVDIIAIAVETGVQNTGIAYVLLSSCLPHPDSDIAGVVPVAGSIITPIPLLIVYCYLKFKDCYCPKSLSRYHNFDDESKAVANSDTNLIIEKS